MSLCLNLHPSPDEGSGTLVYFQQTETHIGAPDWAPQGPNEEQKEGEHEKGNLHSHCNGYILPWRIRLNVIIFRLLLKLSNCFLPQLVEVPKRMEFFILLRTFCFMSLLSFFFLIYFSPRWKDLILVEMPEQMFDFIKLYFIWWFHITLTK